MKNILYITLYFSLVVLACSSDTNGPVEGFPVHLEITVKAYNSIQREYSKVTGAIVELLDYNKNYIKGKLFREFSDEYGIAVFETDSNVLSPNRNYLVVLSHPSNPALTETETEFQMPATPNEGKMFFVQAECIINVRSE
ncbi:hypothetical protein ACFL4T_00560 [candidate division KSB1 bacterium]